MQVQYSDSKIQIEYPTFQEEPQEQGYQFYDAQAYDAIYSPYQPFLKNKNLNMTYEQLDDPLDHIKRRTQFQLPGKKICREQSPSEEESIGNPRSRSTASPSQQDLNDNNDSDHTLQDEEEEEVAYEGELERLVNSIRSEQLSQQIKRLPTPQQIDELWNKLQPPYKPFEGQQRFLQDYLSLEQQHILKVGIDDDIVHGSETQMFKEWVENLCQNDSSRMLKEMARRSKVNRYLEKKHGRTYSKKVHYQIRQKVAEERLRVKGRFVTWSQALDMLNEEREHKKHWNMSDYYLIKKKLSERFGSRKNIKI